MRPPVYILGARIDNLTREEVDGQLEQWLKGGRPRLVVTPNPEMLVAARRDPGLRRALAEASLSVADGVGLVWASRMLGTPIMARYPGVDLLDTLMALAARHQRRVFFVGGQPGVAERAAQRFCRRYPALVVADATDGGEITDPSVMTAALKHRLTRARPEILIAAFGHGKQERWLADHLTEFPGLRLAVGVGGAFDYWSGRARRAPPIARRAGLEWLYRLAREPGRWPRILTATCLFPLLVMIQRRSHAPGSH